MHERDLIKLFVEPLNQQGIRYLVEGSVAAMLYGEPRVTHDIDFMAFLNVEDLHRLHTTFPQSTFYVPPVEAMLAELGREKPGHFNLIHPESGLKADFYLVKRDELDGWAFRRVVQYEVEGITVRVAPPECVIVRKLEFYREGGSDKHLRDIRGMLAVSGDQMDHQELQQWIQRRGLEAQWAKVKMVG